MKHRPTIKWSLLTGSVAFLMLITTSTTRGLIFEIGELTGQLDSTLSIGGSYRTSSPDPDFFGLPNGGNQVSINVDDGNLNYDKGWFSKAIKMTNDFEIAGDNFGAFVRLTSFYDWENEDGTRSFRPLSDLAL